MVAVANLVAVAVAAGLVAGADGATVLVKVAEGGTAVLVAVAEASVAEGGTAVLVAVAEGVTVLVAVTGAVVAVGVSVAVAVTTLFAFTVVAVGVAEETGVCADAGANPNATNATNKNNRAVPTNFFQTNIFTSVLVNTYIIIQLELYVKSPNESIRTIVPN